MAEAWATSDDGEAILSDINDALAAAWQSTEYQPNTIVMPWRAYVFLRRHWMPKRAFRRWRGKVQAQMRLARRQEMACCGK